MNRSGLTPKQVCEKNPSDLLYIKCYGVFMVIMETLFDVISAAIGAIIGATFAFFLNRKRNKQMARQSVISRQELTTLRAENERLLQQIKTKEDIILKMQMQLLGTQVSKKKQKK